MTLIANKEYLKVLSGVELITEWENNYTKQFSCYADFLEWVEGKEILN